MQICFNVDHWLAAKLQAVLAVRVPNTLIVITLPRSVADLSPLVANFNNGLTSHTFNPQPPEMLGFMTGNDSARLQQRWPVKRRTRPGPAPREQCGILQVWKAGSRAF
jgi:hypothetical protein